MATEEFILAHLDPKEDWDKTDISREQYNNLAFSRRKFPEIIALEEKIDVVFDSYKQFEQFVFSVSLDYMLRKEHTSMDWEAANGGFNRSLLNFLTAVKLY